MPQARRPPSSPRTSRFDRAVWEAGDTGRLAAGQVLVGELLCEAVGLHAKERVLDVATGSGNAALAAARRRARVVGVDTTRRSLAHARERSVAERVAIDLARGNAERLPFSTAGFDVVLSTFGVPFFPDPGRAAEELRRVCRPEGRIGLACWSPRGFPAEVLRVLARHAPGYRGLSATETWGTDSGLRELFGAQASVRARKREIVVRADTPSAYDRFFRNVFGPTVLAFSSLPPDDAARLDDKLRQVVDRFNRAEDGTVWIPAAYLESVVRPGGGPSADPAASTGRSWIRTRAR